MKNLQTANQPALPHGFAFDRAREKAMSCVFAQQSHEGYWWYTLEANEAIAAGFIQLMHFLDKVDLEIQRGLVRRMISEQRQDGSWAIFFGGPGDLATTIECYLALRLAGCSPLEDPLLRAKSFILEHGGITKVRVFTRIHLALFGLVPWSSCPSMPVWFMLLPPSCGISIYEFSTWARASIVPLLLLDSVRPVKALSFDLSELFVEPPGHRKFRFPSPKRALSFQSLFLGLDRALKVLEHLPWHPGKKAAVRMAEDWTRAHLAKTEDIYPAMAYGILGLKALGYSNDDPTIRKAFEGLKRFQQRYDVQLPSSPPAPLLHDAGEGCRRRGEDTFLHQQCCISPNWDTPWAGMALLEAGADPDDPRLLKAARYMISKEVRDFRGDWKFKNPNGPTGGWSFEFENDFFPDIDDTLEAVHFLRRVRLPAAESVGPIGRGLAWMLSMQSANGGWAAFDKDNVSGWVNKIPFADHGACLDPPSPDITGRMIELLALFGYAKTDKAMVRALHFLKTHQEECGAWRGRWGVSYIYGTWCVLQGLASFDQGLPLESVRKAIRWLESIQNKDGGWGESCLSDSQNQFVPLGVSTASQTAWAVLGLLAAGEHDSVSVRRGVDWLVRNQDTDGGWEETHFTGTGFPGHFYIRYHGYRYYFPLLALGKYFRTSVS